MRTAKRVAAQLDIAMDKAEKIAALLNGAVDPETYDAVRSWLRVCHHRPPHEDLVLCACDEVLETYGVEAIRMADRCVPYYGDVVATYCNTGDSWQPTVIRDHRRERWVIGCTGNF